MDPFDAITSLVDTAAWNARQDTLVSDSLSIKDEGPHWVEADELFDDFIPYIKNCKYSNCLHNVNEKNICSLYDNLDC